MHLRRIDVLFRSFNALRITKKLLLRGFNTDGDSDVVADGSHPVSHTEFAPLNRKGALKADRDSPCLP